MLKVLQKDASHNTIRAGGPQQIQFTVGPVYIGVEMKFILTSENDPNGMTEHVGVLAQNSILENLMHWAKYC